MLAAAGATTLLAWLVALIGSAQATRQAPAVLHTGGLGFLVGPDGSMDGGSMPAHGSPGRRALTTHNIPNRSSPTEMLIGTKPSFPFSYIAGSRADAPVKFVTKAAGTVQYSGYSWELWDR